MSSVTIVATAVTKNVLASLILGGFFHHQTEWDTDALSCLH